MRREREKFALSLEFSPSSYLQLRLFSVKLTVRYLALEGSAGGEEPAS